MIVCQDSSFKRNKWCSLSLKRKYPRVFFKWWENKTNQWVENVLESFTFKRHFQNSKRGCYSFILSHCNNLFTFVYKKWNRIKEWYSRNISKKVQSDLSGSNVIPFLVKSATLVKHVILESPLLLQNSCESIVVCAFFVARTIVRDK